MMDLVQIVDAIRVLRKSYGTLIEWFLLLSYNLIGNNQKIWKTITRTQMVESK